MVDFWLPPWKLTYFESWIVQSFVLCSLSKQLHILFLNESSHMYGQKNSKTVSSSFFYLVWRRGAMRLRKRSENIHVAQPTILVFGVASKPYSSTAGPTCTIVHSKFTHQPTCPLFGWLAADERRNDCTRVVSFVHEVANRRRERFDLLVTKLRTAHFFAECVESCVSHTIMLTRKRIRAVYAAWISTLLNCQFCICGNICGMGLILSRF